MALRGRGCLELRHSDNPFFQPVSADIGRTTKDAVSTTWKVSGSPPRFSSQKHEVDGNFAFLYTRESDRIGAKVTKPMMPEVKMMTRTEFLKQRRERAQQEQLALTEHGEPGAQETEEHPVDAAGEIVGRKLSPEEYLQVYRHEPKYEDPRYMTSTAEYGRKPPTVATIVTERASRKQNFSKSFNNVKPMNTSLTTALTKSNVHKQLDPQFA